MSQPDQEPRAEGVLRGTFRHAVVYSGAGLLARVVSFFMLPFYAHILRDIGYGVLGMIDAGLGLLSSLFAYNFSGGILRHYHAETTPERKKLVVSTGTILAGAIVTPLGAVGVLLSKPASNLMLGTPEYWPLICMALGSFVLSMIDRTAFHVLVITRRSGLVSVISLLLLVVSLGLNILLVLVLRWGLTGYFLAGLLATVLSTAISLVIMGRLCGFGWDRGIARSLLAYQLPLIPGSIASFAARQAERIIVRFQLDLASVGVLEMSYKFPILINAFVVLPFNKSWATKRMEIADDPGGLQEISRVFTYYLFVTTFVALLLVVNIQTILMLLTPPEFWAAARIARIEAAQYVVLAIGSHTCFGLYYAKRTDLISRVMVVTSVVKMGLAYLMISTFGLYGAAWSALLTSAVYVAWTGFLAQRFYRIDFERLKLSMIVIAATIVVISIDRVSTEQIAAWGEPLLRVARDGLNGLKDTTIGEWRDGKVLTILIDRGELVLDLVVRTGFSCAFLLLAPLVHDDWRRLLAARLIGGRRMLPWN